MSPYELTSHQQNIIASDLHDQTSTKNILYCKYDLSRYNVDLIIKSTHYLIENSRDLNIRFVFNTELSLIRQYYGQPDLTKLETVDFSQDTNALDNWLESHEKSAFENLWESPLYEFTLLKTEQKHVLFLKIHHGITDGVGVHKLGTRIQQICEALEKGKAPSSFSDDYLAYEKKQSAYSTSKQFIEDQTFWAGYDAAVEDYPEAINYESSKMRILTVELPKKLTIKINNIQPLVNVILSPYNVALTAISLYLLKRFQAPKIPIVMAAGMRRHLPKEAQETIGMLVSTLVLNIEDTDGQNFLTALAHHDKTLKKCLKHSNYPILKRLDRLSSDNISHNKLMNFYVVSNSSIDNSLLSDVRLSDEALAPFVFKINHLQDDKDGLQSIEINYIEEILSDNSASFMADGILSFITKLVENPELDISQIDIICDEEKLLLLQGFQGKSLDYETDKTFIHHFSENAEKSPQNIAIVDTTGPDTYQSIEQKSNAFAKLLVGNYTPKGRFISVMLPRDRTYYTAIVSIMKAQAAYVPLDNTYPKERLEYILEDSDSSLLITSHEYDGVIDNPKCPVLYIEDIVIQDDCIAPKLDVLPEDYAYMIYTSGSTGKPKGVKIRHQSLSAFNAWRINDFKYTNTSSSCVFSTFSFDASTYDLFPVVEAGGTLYIISEDMRFDMSGFYKYAKDNKIQDCIMPTKLGIEFMSSYQVPFKILSLGGEKLSSFPRQNAKVVNVYGPTEFTVVSHYHTVDQDKTYSNIPIGKPVSNLWNYIVDKQFHIVPLGCEGELCLAGKQISAGYQNLEEETKSVFVVNPYSTCDENKLMYRTGDIVKWNEDGDIEYCGRIGNQVKVRGFRIELGEIETAISAFEGVITGCAVVKDDTIATYYTTTKDVDENLLRIHLEESLPEYMVPSVLKHLEEMPTTPAGKIDIRALPEIEIITEKIVPPQTTLQKEIYAIIATVLSHNEFGITTNLFHVGMSSLMAIKITSLISEKYEISLSAKYIIKAQTIENIELLILNTDKQEDYIYEMKEDYPLPHNMMGIYSACMLNPEADIYNIASTIDFSLAVDVSKLAQAFCQVIDAHPYLKTQLTIKGDSIRQVRRDQIPVSIEVLETTENEFEKIEQRFVKPFTLIDSDLYRAIIYVTEERIILLSDFHHIIFDGGSLDILLKDLQKAYNEEKLKKETYSSYELALDEHQIIGSPKYIEAENYFKTLLINFEEVSALKEKTTKPDQIAKAEVVDVAISKHNIEQFCKTHKITNNILFLAATSYVLSRFTNSRTADFVTVENGRANYKTQNIMGMLVKTLPVSTSFDQTQSTLDYLNSISDQFFKTLENDSIPFTKISTDYNFSPDFCYTYQGGMIEEYIFAEDPVKITLIRQESPKFKIGVLIEDIGEEFRIDIEYNNTLFNHSTIEGLGKAIKVAVEHFIANPTLPITKQDLVSDLDKSMILDDLQGEKLVYDKQKNFIHHFNEHAVNSPNKIAVVDCESHISYGDLNRKSDILAKALLEKFTTPGKYCSIMLPRRISFYASVLAVMKSRGAYIPIDPEYPQDRIEYMVENSNSAVLITSKIFTDKLEHLSTPILFIEDIDFNSTAIFVEELPQASDLAYMIYTSGSTGKPKGVQISHQSLSAFLAWNKHDFNLTEESSSCVFSTFSFDASIGDLFPVVFAGGTLHIISEEMRYDMPGFCNYVSDNKIDNAIMPTKLGVELLTSYDISLKQLMLGGEKMPPLPKRSCKVINGYGPTEFTMASSYHVLDYDREYKGIPIGKPVANSWNYIVDQDQNLLPHGCDGELCLSGSQLSIGYCNLENTTKKVFISNPFATCNENRLMYRTGDIVRWNNENELDYVGRSDNQVKLSGFRIELGEIENIIADYEGVSNTVVLVVDEQLIAYYTSTTVIDETELFKTAKEMLPHYMVPSVLIRLEVMPTTPAGKIDTRALPAPMRIELEYIAPTNDTERLICDLFCQVLTLDRIGIEDSFFDLGGSSLVAIKLTIAALNNKLAINYADVFEHKTPKNLAEHVLKTKDTATDKNQTEAEYDYTAINNVLSKNTLDNYRSGKKTELGNVLLAGATGYLGIHILHELICHETSKIVCVIRPRKKITALEYLKTMLYYYFSDLDSELFGTKIDTLFEERITVLEGDITNKESLDNCRSHSIKTLINCAGIVKHFAADSIMEKVNVDGVKNCIDFCMENDALFIQTSTYSVGGMNVDNKIPNSVVLSEQSLSFGQDLSNKYINSKFKAERLVLENIGQGLHGKIMRVGNLMARASDEEFQINFQTNGFLNQIKGYAAIGSVPYSLLENFTEFSPIDCTAKAILMLSKTPKPCTVFHPYNINKVSFSDIFTAMYTNGIEVEAVEDDVFTKHFSDAMKDSGKAESLIGLISYFDTNNEISSTDIPAVCTYTNSVLLREKFSWPLATQDYLAKLIEKVNGLAFFDV